MSDKPKPITMEVPVTVLAGLITEFEHWYNFLNGDLALDTDRSKRVFLAAAEKQMRRHKVWHKRLKRDGKL
jgi:hypothetical protein